MAIVGKANKNVVTDDLLYPRIKETESLGEIMFFCFCLPK